jgi:hypothetical protein
VHPYVNKGWTDRRATCCFAIAMRPLPTIYELHVSLLDIEPLIWRRLLVSADARLVRISRVIQTAMGWSGAHPWSFEVEGAFYDAPDLEAPLGPNDARLVRLRQLLPDVGRTIVYEYDFGDSWRHLVRLDQIRPPDPLTRLPFCTDGARACPPEDIGGPFGYAELLVALRERDDPVQAELLASVGGSFDAESLDLVAVNAALAKLPQPR